MHLVPERALDDYRRQRFLDEMNSAFAALNPPPRRTLFELLHASAMRTPPTDCYQCGDGARPCVSIDHCVVFGGYF